MFHLDVSPDGLTWTRVFSHDHPWACNRRICGDAHRWKRVWADHLGEPIATYFDGRSIGEFLREAEMLF